MTLEKGPLSEFFERTRNMTPEQRAKDLELDINLKQAHQNFATLGQTEAPDAQDDVDLHFVCIVHKDGYIYELDGRKCRPINHGKSSPETFISVFFINSVY